MDAILTLLDQLDASLLLAINGAHTPFWDTFMYLFSGKWIWVPMYASLVFLVFRNLPWRTALLCLVGVALTITLADQLGASLIRPWAERLRPSNLGNPLSDYVHIVRGYRGGSYGFPSCHAANTVALTVYLTLVLRRRLVAWLLGGWALLTCYSRAYLGVHYPGDLLAGALLGGLCALAVYGLLRWLARYRAPEAVRGGAVPAWVLGLTVAFLAACSGVSIFLG